jgi:hypothetical protein
VGSHPHPGIGTGVASRTAFAVKPTGIDEKTAPLFLPKCPKQEANHSGPRKRCEGLFLE